MNSRALLVAALLLLAGCSVLSTSPPQPPVVVAPPSQTDPFAPVYIVTSDATWQGIRGLARGVATPRDSTKLRV